MGRLLNVCVFLFFSYHICLARYTTDPESGSGEGDGTALTSATQSYGFTTEYSVKNVNGTTNSSNILDTIKHFLSEYMLLVIVVGSLVVLLLVTMCAAVIMSHKRKASAYYPSSFAPKEYVNHDDRNGGARAFNEIPEKPHDAKSEDVLTSSNTLQTDILNAAQNLKSPNKKEQKIQENLKSPNKKEQKIQEEPKTTQEPLKKKRAEDTSSSSSSSSESEDEPMEDKAKEAPIKPEKAAPTCNCHGNPADHAKEMKPTEEIVPPADPQEAPSKPEEVAPPPANSEGTPTEKPEETKPAETPQEVPAGPTADPPNAPEQANGKEEGTPTPNECGTEKNTPCNSQESPQTPETEPCGV